MFRQYEVGGGPACSQQALGEDPTHRSGTKNGYLWLHPADDTAQSRILNTTMKRLTLLALVVAVPLASCSGGESSGTPSLSSPTTTTGALPTTSGPLPATTPAPTPAVSSTPPSVVPVPVDETVLEELHPSSVEANGEVGARWRAENLIDGDLATEWQYDTASGRRAILTFLFDVPVSIYEIEVLNLPDDDRFILNHSIHRYVINACCFIDEPRVSELAYVNISQRIGLGWTDFTGFVEFEILSTYASSAVGDRLPFDELAVADFRFFGRKSPLPGEGAATEFCRFVATNDGASLAPVPRLIRLWADIFTDLSPDNLRTVIVGSVADVASSRGIAPSAIGQDVDIVAEFMSSLENLLDEVEYNVRDLDRDDAALNDSGFVAALDRLSVFCDVSLDDALDEVAIAAGIPNGLPQVLVPPAVTNRSYFGGGLWVVATAAGFDEVVAEYTTGLGPPFFNGIVEENPGGDPLVQAIWNTVVDGNLMAVELLGQGGELLITILYVG